MLPGQTQNKCTLLISGLFLLTIFPALNAASQTLAQAINVTKPICFSYEFPLETSDLVHKERDDAYTLATDTNGQLKTSIKLRTMGLLRVAKPESTPVYFSSTLIVLSFKIQQSLETIKAYEFFSLSNPKKEPLSFINDNPIVDFTISPDESCMAVKSEQTWYIISTLNTDQQTQTTLQPLEISLVEGQDCAIHFIPYTEWVILCYHSTIDKNSPPCLCLRSLKTGSLKEKIDGHCIRDCFFITQCSETPFILFKLDDGSTQLCFIDGNSFNVVEKNVIHCMWRHNRSMTGYILSTTKKNQKNTREYLKKEFQSTAPNTPESTLRRSASSSSCGSSTYSSLNSSPQSTAISTIEETLPFVHIAQTPSPEPRADKRLPQKLQGTRI